ncbi:unnamed protein product [Leptosia nina]|uniref:Secreted protein n=1 Tax=Leptosia nina TaxID=320188 RepID=A0AAV1JJ16_9NEOP
MCFKPLSDDEDNVTSRPAAPPVVLLIIQLSSSQCAARLARHDKRMRNRHLVKVVRADFVFRHLRLVNLLSSLRQCDGERRSPVGT